MPKIDFTGKPGEYTYTEGEYGKHNYGVVKVGATSERDAYAQRTVGGNDREAGDHGGHLIAHSLGGRNDKSNMDPQAANVNQIGQRSVERDVANLASDPNKTVYMDVQNYSGDGSQRPSATMMTVAVQDHETGKIDVEHYSFQNASYEEQEQWNEIANQDTEIDPRQDIGMTPEERELANEYAEEPVDTSLGDGFTVFLDQDAAPITEDMNDGGNMDLDSGTAVDDGMDGGTEMGADASVGSEAEGGMDSGADGGIGDD